MPSSAVPASQDPALDLAQEPSRLSWPARLSLVLAVLLSIPDRFEIPPDIGLDNSWILSLQLATLKGDVFGRDYVFTYGPLGWLFVRASLQKPTLLIYDLFVMGSLACLYWELLRKSQSLRRVMLVLVPILALVTRAAFMFNPPSVVFAVLCWWLWRVRASQSYLPVAAAWAAGVVLFLGKANYAMVVVLLIAFWSAALVVQPGQLRRKGLLLFGGFGALIALSPLVWRIDLIQYCRTNLELISGYPHAMQFAPAKDGVLFYIAVATLGALFVLAVALRQKLRQVDHWVLSATLLLAAGLLYKNAFTRQDYNHVPGFALGAPVVIAIWAAAIPASRVLRALLFATLLPPLAGFLGVSMWFWNLAFPPLSPHHYFTSLYAAPFFRTPANLSADLQAKYPVCVFPAAARKSIGDASVDVMPWESSVAVLNGLHLRPRPVLQSYAAYTPSLDRLNSDFLASSRAPDIILFTHDSNWPGIDSRAAAWDESITRRALLERYSLAEEFTVPLRFNQLDPFRDATIFVLHKSPRPKTFHEVSSAPVSIAMNQDLVVPASDNFLYLSVDFQYTPFGKLRSAAKAAAYLAAKVTYADGTSKVFRTPVPLLRGGILINRRAESADELRNFLAGQPQRNPAIATIRFNTVHPGDFQPIARGVLTEYHLTDPGN